MPNVLLKAPASTVGQVQTKGASYAIDDNGFVSVPSAAVGDLLGAGFTYAPGSSSVDLGANGIPMMQMRLLDVFSQDGAPTAAAAAAGDFGLTCTPGTALYLIGEVANNNTKTDKALIEFVVPQSYVAGQDLSVVVNCDLDGAGTSGTKTIDCEAWVQANAGTGTVDICATAAQSFSATATDYTFTLTGTTVVPGDKLLIQLTMVLQETAATAINGRINSIRIS